MRPHSQLLDKVTLAGTQVAQWDFQNKSRSRWACTSCFVLEVPLCNLRPSMCAFVPCDRVVQRDFYKRTRIATYVLAKTAVSAEHLHLRCCRQSLLEIFVWKPRKKRDQYSDLSCVNKDDSTLCKDIQV